MVAISNVGNKYICAIETTFGVTPTFTSLDMGHVQKISVTEEENTEKVNSLNSGHTSAKFEDGLYWVPTTIETRVTKASLPNVLKACMGSYSDDATDYTMATSLTTNSYSWKVSYVSTTKVLLINGFVVKDFTISNSKGGFLTITMNGISMLVTKSVEAISPSTNTDTVYSWLDCYATVGGTAYVLQNFTINGNWNVTDDEGRGLEAVSSNERRLIRGVLKHRFDCSGSYEIELSDSSEIGYVDDRSDEAIVFTASRSTDNAHVFTMANTRSSNRSYEAGIDNSKRAVSYNFEALDLAVTGDL